MADQDYPSLYAAEEAAAARATAAATSFLAMLGGAVDALVPVLGYPDQPSFAKRIADMFNQQEVRFITLAPESGYAFAIADSQNRAAILIGLDGAVTIPKFAAAINSIDGRSLITGTVTKESLVDEVTDVLADILQPETGYVWAVVDDNGKMGLALTLDGFVEGKFRLMAKSIATTMLADDVTDVLAKTLSPESGYVWVVTDSLGRIALGITADGKVVGDFDVPAPPDPAGLKYLVPLIDLLCAGDSLTANSSQITWREQLVPLISARTIYNGGIGGQTATQIAGRFGAGRSLVSVTGDQIPTSGAVTLTGITIQLLSTPAISSGTTTMKGYLAGILGTLSCTHAALDANDVYTFTRDVAGDARYSAPKSPFEPVVAGDGFYTNIIWMGRNDLNDGIDIEITKTAIRRMVALQKTTERRFLIITPPMGGTQVAGQSTAEGIGTAKFNQCVALEDWATNEFGDRVIKIREWLMQFNNGSADDLDDVAKGVVPRSLRIDTQHNTTASNGFIAQRIAYEINRRAW